MALTGHWRVYVRALIILSRPASGWELIRSQHLVNFPLVETGAGKTNSKETEPVARFLQKLWKDDRGQDIAEYAVMLAVILVIVVGTIRLIGSNANNVFSNVGSAIQ
jgi:Flp pilus assembly pilin Flp